MTIPLVGMPSREVFVCHIELEQLFMIEEKMGEGYEEKGLQITIEGKERVAHTYLKSPAERETVTEDGLILF